MSIESIKAELVPLNAELDKLFAAQAILMDITSPLTARLARMRADIETLQARQDALIAQLDAVEDRSL